MDEQEHISSLERVRRRLYSTTDVQAENVGALSQKPAYETKGWEKLKAERITKVYGEHLSAPVRFLITAFVLFALALIGTGLYLYFGGRSVSTKNVVVHAGGPSTIASGDTVPLLVALDNKNPAALRNVSITVVYPEGTKDPSDPSKPLPSVVENVGDIASGGHLEKTIRASVFGSEGARITLPITIRYTVDGSTSTFEVHSEYDFVVTSSPIALTVASISQISSGQPVSIKVSVKSNATADLNNVAVSAEYPFGFTLTNTDPKANGTFFYLGTLSPGEERTITISGVPSGESGDERVFKFSGGITSSDQASKLTTAYSNKEVSLQITKPFLATSLSIGGDTGESPVLVPGASTPGIVTWTNNLASAITNAQVSIRLSGEALDPASVTSGSGFYRSSDSTLVFNSGTNPSLGKLSTGASGQGNFTFATKKPEALQSMRSPTITMVVSISGQRVSESNVPETVSSTLTRTIRVGTNLNLTDRAVRTIGPLANTGPWPPVVNQETTYTVQFTLSSDFNSVGGARVSATLPNYVRYTGVTSPADGSLSYDEASRTVSWNAGDVDAGKTKTISFQVGLTPSVSQSGMSVTLLNAGTVTGTDRFTQKQIQGTVKAITTQTTQDPAYTDQKGKVQ